MMLRKHNRNTLLVCEAQAGSGGLTPPRPPVRGQSTGPGNTQASSIRKIPAVISARDLLEKKQFQTEVLPTSDEQDVVKSFNLAEGVEDGEEVVYPLDYLGTAMQRCGNAVEKCLESPFGEDQTRVSSVEQAHAILNYLKWLNRLHNNLGQRLSVLDSLVANRLNHLRQVNSKRNNPVPGQEVKLQGVTYVYTDTLDLKRKV